MLHIKAIIRPERFEAVRDALHGIGVEFFTYSDVAGVTYQQEQKYAYRGRAVYDSGSSTRRVVELVVPEIDAPEAIATIKDAANTGMAGDGKIFVWNVDQSIRISQ